ncbi:hypothetical protein DRJ16_05840, partial [Candidatus Woesearchaeota archaeon]
LKGDKFYIDAEKSKNAFLCENIKNQNCKDICYFELALETKDVSLCEKIINEGNKNTCFEQLGLSDKELLNYAKSHFDKEKVMGKNFILGYHNGIPVRVSFPCSDVCPRNTIRIIRYDVSLGKCESVGGEIKSIYVPFDEALKAEAFCFPKVIVENNIYNFVPNVVVFTDKTEYENEEEINIIVKNNRDNKIFHCGAGDSGWKWNLKKKENGSWREIDGREIFPSVWTPPLEELAPNETFSVVIKKEVIEKTIGPGIYKIGFKFFPTLDHSLKLLQANCWEREPNIVYSNEFTIK